MIKIYSRLYSIINYIVKQYMITVLVTGGSGMIGKNLQDLIKNTENKDIEWLFPTSDELNLMVTESIDKYLLNNNIDYIVHLAANVGGLYKNLRYKVEMFRDNIIMNENILYYANKYDIQNGIFCCSTCIFPDNPSKYPMTENMIMDGIPHYSNASYAYSKRLLYFQCKNYNYQYDRKYICITPTNIYGKYDNFNLCEAHFIPALIHKFYLAEIEKSTLDISTGLNSMRQVINAYDISKIVYEMISSFNKIDYDNIILANNEMSIVDLIKIISNSFPSVKYNILDNEQGQIKKTCSNELFKSKFPNFKFTDTEIEIKETIEWFRSNYDNIRK